jgi:putative N-acetylmannosamine-6-phosphate epimerase
LIKKLRGGLIVSYQALPDEPLYAAHHMAAMAGAAVELPIIRLFKENIPGFDVRITSSVEHSNNRSGVDNIALDATPFTPEWKRSSMPGWHHTSTACASFSFNAASSRIFKSQVFTCPGSAYSKSVSTRK